MTGGTNQFGVGGFARGQTVADDDVAREAEGPDIASIGLHLSVNGLGMAVIAVAAGERAVLKFIEQLRRVRSVGIVTLTANSRLERLSLVRGDELLRSRIVAVETELRLRGTRLAIVDVA
jgi:hypothetical protein